MDRYHLVSIHPAGVFESRAGNAHRRRFRDYFQALDDIGHDFVLDAGVEIFGVLAEDDEVDRQVLKARLQAGQHLDRAEIYVEIEPLAQGDIHARVAFRDGCCDGALETDARPFERREDGFGQHLAGFQFRFLAGVNALPLHRNAGSFNGANRCICDFRADSVAGN